MVEEQTAASHICALIALHGRILQKSLEVLKLYAIGAHHHGDQGVAKGFGYRQVVSGLSHGSVLLSWAVARVPPWLHCPVGIDFRKKWCYR
jgi:hypothetical protein